MELKILNSILHNELRPWILNKSDKEIAEKLKKAGKSDASNMDDLTQQVKILVEDYQALSKWVDKQGIESTKPISSLYYSTELPLFKNVITKYYSVLISKEVERIFNTFLLQSVHWDSDIMIIYNTNMLLKNVKALTKQVFKEIEDKELDRETQEDYITAFVLQYLKDSLLTLFFSVQEVQKDKLEQLLTLEDFYLLELNQPLEKMQELTFTGTDTKEVNVSKAKKKLTFGFTGDKEKLRTVISQLNRQIELLDEHTPSSDLFEVLTSKSIPKKSVKIRLGCETVQFIYVIHKLSNHFNNLTPKTIQESEIFYSKGNTLIKAQNLYKNKINNPKNKEMIDKIINQLQ